MADLSQFLYGQQSMQPIEQPLEAPAGIRTPWQGLPPKKADEARMRASEFARKKLDENSAVLNKIGGVVQQMQQFNELNQQNRTGEIYSGILPEWATGAAEQQMSAITAELAPNKRVEGSGTTSDKDIALYLKSVPSITKKGSVNTQILNQTQAQYQKAQQKLQFLQNYYDKYGHLNGADAIWSKQNAFGKKGGNATQQLINEADAIISGVR